MANDQMEKSATDFIESGTSNLHRWLFRLAKPVTDA
jgi:hypothetical protein